MVSYDTDEYIDSIAFHAPETKDSYCLSKTKKKVYCDVIDVKIMNIQKMKTGYMLTLYLDAESRRALTEIDKVSIINLLTNNNSWFNNELTDDEVKAMFFTCYCEQTNTMKAYIRNVQGINIYQNNKPLELADFVTSFRSADYKQCMVNMKLQLLGMYIYKKQTINKWCINTINIYDNTEDMVTESKDEVEAFWKEMVDRCDEILKKRIENIEASRQGLRSSISAITDTHGTADWEAKIAGLKKLTQNIIF